VIHAPVSTLLRCSLRSFLFFSCSLQKLARCPLALLPCCFNVLFYDSGPGFFIVFSLFFTMAARRDAGWDALLFS
jgi:hypothetical protein